MIQAHRSTMNRTIRTSKHLGLWNMERCSQQQALALSAIAFGLGFTSQCIACWRTGIYNLSECFERLIARSRLRNVVYMTTKHNSPAKQKTKFGRAFVHRDVLMMVKSFLAFWFWKHEYNAMEYEGEYVWCQGFIRFDKATKPIVCQGSLAVW